MHKLWGNRNGEVMWDSKLYNIMNILMLDMLTLKWPKDIQVATSGMQLKKGKGGIWFQGESETRDL